MGLLTDQLQVGLRLSWLPLPRGVLGVKSLDFLLQDLEAFFLQVASIQVIDVFGSDLGPLESLGPPPQELLMRLEHGGLSYLLGGTLVWLGLGLVFCPLSCGGWLENIMEKDTYLLFPFLALFLLLFGPDLVDDVKILPLDLRLVDLLVEGEHVHEQVASLSICRHQGVEAGLAWLEVNGHALWEH